MQPQRLPVMGAPITAAEGVIRYQRANAGGAVRGWTCRSAECLTGPSITDGPEYAGARYREQHVEPEQDWRELVGEIHQTSWLEPPVCAGDRALPGLCRRQTPAATTRHVQTDRAPGSCALLKGWRAKLASQEARVSPEATAPLRYAHPVPTASAAATMPEQRAQAPPMMVAFRTYGPIGLIA